MQRWLRRVRGAVGMGLMWALGGLCVGGLIELIDNLLPAAHPVTRLVDMWPQVLAAVGFVAGVVFATVLGIAGGRRRFDELSLPRFAAWGAVAGLLLGVLAVVAGAPAVFIAVTTLGSAIAASGSLVLARRAEGRGLLHAGADGAEAARPEGEAQELLGRRD